MRIGLDSLLDTKLIKSISLFNPFMGQQENKMEENMNNKMAEAINAVDAQMVLETVSEGNDENVIHVQTADEIGVENTPVLQ